MKKYIKPQTTVLTIESGLLMQTGSIIDGYTETQLIKEEGEFLDSEELYSILQGWD